jgi:quercetin dioxygenase-like cupin family protein
MQIGASFTRIDSESADRFVRLGRDLGVVAFGMNVIILRPGQRLRIHRHARQEEAYVVLAGILTLSIEGEDRPLEQGEVARVAPDVRRQLVNRDPSRACVVLAVGAAGEHVSRDAEAFVDWHATTGGPPQEIPLPEDFPTDSL